MDRRKFIEASGAAAGIAMLGNVNNTFAGNSETSKPAQGGKANIKLGLYSISYGGVWYVGKALSFEDFCKRAKDYGFDGVELDNKRPMGCPLDLSTRRRDEMVNTLQKNGLEIPAIAANNDFSSPVPEHRECQLLMVRETARLAKDLGAKIVRLFAAWPGVVIHEGVGTYDLTRSSFYTFERQYPFATRLDRWNFVKDCLKEAAAYGEEFGVMMTLQNHAPLLNTWRDTLDMVREVNSPWLKVCLDLPIMDNLDNDYVTNAVRTVGDLQVHSHFGGEYYRDKDGTIKAVILDYYAGGKNPDYNHYIGLMNEINYNGYFTFELCHPILNADRTRGDIGYVDNQVKLAREFLGKIVGR
jgi:sugar phosphate isomerase/epimerase